MGCRRATYIDNNSVHGVHNAKIGRQPVVKAGHSLAVPNFLARWNCAGRRRRRKCARIDPSIRPRCRLGPYDAGHRLIRINCFRHALLSHAGHRLVGVQCRPATSNHSNREPHNGERGDSIERHGILPVGRQQRPGAPTLRRGGGSRQCEESALQPVSWAMPTKEVSDAVAIIAAPGSSVSWIMGII